MGQGEGFRVSYRWWQGHKQVIDHQKNKWERAYIHEQVVAGAGAWDEERKGTLPRSCSAQATRTGGQKHPM
jgi:hypothetical protein